MTRTNTICFSSGEPSVEVLRLSKDGIWANPDIPVDEAAKFVLNAIGDNIEVLVQAAVKAEREACAKEVDHILKEGGGTYGDAIRARGQA
jgi:hypothetical protein